MPDTNSSITWIGTADILELPGSEVTVESSTTATTVTLQGPWADLLANYPQIGQSLQDSDGIRYPGTVRKVVLRKEDGEVGQAVVHLVAENTKPENRQLGPPRYEVRWETMQKPLETHPIFNGGDSEFSPIAGAEMKTSVTVEFGSDLDEEQKEAMTDLFGSTKTFTTTTAKLVQTLKNAPPASRDIVYKYAKGFSSGVVELLKKFFEKWEAGEQAWDYSYPVATKSAPFTRPQRPGKTSVINTPDGFGDALPQGYTWIKTADSSTFTGAGGACEHSQAWKGLKNIDRDLYK